MPKPPIKIPKQRHPCECAAAPNGAQIRTCGVPAIHRIAGKWRCSRHARAARTRLAFEAERESA